MEQAELFARVARRYHRQGRAAESYVRGKLRHDPVHQDILSLAAADDFGDVLDIGCGRAQLGLALLEAGLARSVRGLDRHAAHLAQAAAAAAGLAFHAAVADLADAPVLPAADTILLIDVLYQLTDRAQHDLLRAVVGSARRRVIIRALDPDRGVRSWVSLGVERLIRRVSPNSGAYVRPMSVAAISRVLAERGLVVSVAPCWRGTPFANVLIIGRR